MSPPDSRPISRLRELGWVVAVVSVLVAWVQATHALRRIDNLIYDYTLKGWPAPSRDDIVIVAIDAASLSQLGRWPWSRTIHAALLDQLTEQGARAVGLDLLLPESDPATGADDHLAAALAANKRTVLALAPEVRDHDVITVALPIPSLRQAAARLGHADTELDADAVLRGAFLRAGTDGKRWSALALAMLEVAARQPEPLPGARPPTATVVAGRWRRDHQIRIPFSAPGSIRQVSYVDVLNDARVAGSLRDRFVLVGPTAAGLAAAFATPVSGENRPLYGVEFDANVLAALLNRAWILPLPPLVGAAVSLLVALLPLLVYPRLSPQLSLLPYVVSIAATLIAAMALLHVGHLWAAPVASLLGLVIGYPLWSWRRLQLAGAERRWQMEHARVTLNSIGEAVITTNVTGTILYLNPTAERLSGWDLKAACGQHYREIFAPDDSAAEAKMRDALFHCQAHGDPRRRSDQVTLLNRAGQPYAVHFTANPVHDARAEIAGFVLALRDITVMLSLTERMTHQATHDHLTELPNRVLTTDRVTQALASARRSGELVAVLFLDLDGFKRINDSLGHATGDALLQMVARRLVSAGRAGDTVGRWGGDEFVIVLEGLLQESAISGVARKVVDHFKDPIQLPEHELFVTPSIGIAVFPKDGADADLLIRNADIAMYRVKHQGGNTYRFYSERIPTWTTEHITTEKDMRSALQNGGFELLYQPQVNLTNGRIEGVEALLRWRHPRRGLLLPDQFIPIAEESGLIHELGLRAFELACAQGRRWQEQHLEPVRIGVNVSARQLQREGLVLAFGEILHQSGVAPASITVEITESAVMHDVARIADMLRGFKALGVQVAIDDFGTGYSSLTHIKRFPIDEVKIDQSFVRDISTDTNDAAIVQAVIAMAHSMDMRVVAEGVETRAQFEFLAARRCDELQGYYFSPAIAAADFTVMLLRQQAHLQSTAEVFEQWPNMVRDGKLGELELPPPSRRH